MNSSDRGSSLDQDENSPQQTVGQVYYPKCADEKLAERIIQAVQRVELYSELVHEISDKKLNQALDQGLKRDYQNRNSYKPKNLVQFRPRLDHGYQKIQTGRILVDYSPNFKPKTELGGISFSVSRQQLSTAPTIFYNLESIYLAYSTNYLRIGNSTFHLDQSSGSESERRPFGFVENYFHANPIQPDYVEQSNQILKGNDFKKLNQTLLLDYFKFIDHYQHAHPTSHAVQEIYQAIAGLTEEELISFLHDLSLEITSHVKFYLQDGYQLDFNSVNTIYHHGYYHDEPASIDLDILILELESGEVLSLQNIQRVFPNLLKSYRFIDYLLANVTHPAAIAQLTILLTACPAPENVVDRSIDNRLMNVDTKAKFNLLSAERRKQNGLKNFFIRGEGNTRDQMGNLPIELIHCAPGWRDYLFDQNCSAEQLKSIMAQENAKTKLGKMFPEIAADLELFERISSSKNSVQLADNYKQACWLLGKNEIKIDDKVRALLIDSIDNITPTVDKLIKAQQEKNQEEKQRIEALMKEQEDKLEVFELLASVSRTVAQRLQQQKDAEASSVAPVSVQPQQNQQADNVQNQNAQVPDSAGTVQASGLEKSGPSQHAESEVPNIANNTSDETRRIDQTSHSSSQQAAEAERVDEKKIENQPHDEAQQDRQELTVPQQAAEVGNVNEQKLENQPHNEAQQHRQELTVSPQAADAERVANQQLEIQLPDDERQLRQVLAVSQHSVHAERTAKQRLIDQQARESVVSQEELEHYSLATQEVAPRPTTKTPWWKWTLCAIAIAGGLAACATGVGAVVGAPALAGAASALGLGLLFGLGGGAVAGGVVGVGLCIKHNMNVNSLEQQPLIFDSVENESDAEYHAMPDDNAIGLEQPKRGRVVNFPAQRSPHVNLSLVQQSSTPIRNSSVDGPRSDYSPR